MGTITLSNATIINVGMGETIDLNNFIVSNSLTINDSTGDEDISGTSSSDTLNLNSGNDTIDLGGGDDTIDVATMANLTSADIITDSAGTDTLNINGAGTIASSDFNVSGFENLNLSSGVDEVTFTDKSSFDSFKGKFSSGIDTKGSSDEFSFSSQVTNDLDFSNVSNLESLDFNGTNNSITYGSEEATAGVENITLGTGTDNFNLDFSNIASLSNVDGETGTDTITLTNYNNATVTSALNGVFDNMETLDLSGTGTFTIDSEVINNWRDSGNSIFTISGSSDDTLNITTSDANYRWTTNESDWAGTGNSNDISNAGAGDYFIDINNDNTTDITLHVVA